MALSSNDSADEIEYLKLLNVMVIVYPCYYEKGVFWQSNELDPETSVPGATPSYPILHLLVARCLTHPLFGSLRGPCTVAFCNILRDLLKAFLNVDC